jgi:hypothetical protein
MTNPTAGLAVPRRSGPGALALFAGPLAWFAELNLGYALATEPCFATDQRLAAPAPNWAWTHAGLFGLAGLCLVVALWSFLICWAALRRESGTADSITAAGNRCRFAALWGVAFGGGFFVATLLTGVGLVLLPRCGG